MMMGKITIDNIDYDDEKLSKEAKAQLLSLRFVDNEILRIQALLATYQTARNAYASALKEMLPKTPKTK